jgi:hypothetical protein
MTSLKTKNNKQKMLNPSKWSEWNCLDLQKYNWLIQCTVKPVLRGHLWDKEKVVVSGRWPLKRGAIHMKFSITR